jgi:two-component system, chemotaxis family, CheB/CheR fusion protein
MSKLRAGPREVPDETRAATATFPAARSGAELEQALRENQRAREESEAVTRGKDRFLARLSHELRTPLTPIVMALQTLVRRSDLPESAREALEMIHRNVKIESNLIDDFLDLTRITHGRFDIDSAPVDLHAAITGAVDICESDVRGKKQTLIVTLQASRHRTQGDFERLRQVVFNLVQNASKFTRESGEIQVASRNEDGRFLLTVSDNGSGIARDALPAIFDPFRRGSQQVTSEFGGVGLGLAIAKASVEAHGGTIRAESAGPSCGAIFTVQLPLT